jgi:predicted phage terminase large subunit-like protein
MTETLSRDARLMLYVEALVKLRRKRNAIERMRFLYQNPDAINDDDLDMLRDMDGRQRRWLFTDHPHLRQLYNDYLDTPDKIISSLHEFTRRAYRYSGLPGNFRSNWHIREMCRQYEGIHKKDVTRLMVNIPPSCSKSVIANVFFPAWVWAQTPEWGIANFSYSDAIPNRDRETLSRLINSVWYQRRWGHVFRLTKDSNEMMATNRGGWRFGGGVGGAGTGMHPHLITIDDPHKALDVASKIEMARVAKWFANTISTRGMILRTAIILLMQRLAPNDLCGVILGEGGMGEGYGEEIQKSLSGSEWLHLCFPMHFDPDHRYRCDYDRRTKRGELLWPDMIDEAKVRATMKEMALAGDPNVSAQFEQNPLADAGTIFEGLNEARIRREHLPEKIEHGRTVRAWDKADSTDATGDASAGTLMTEYNDIRYILNQLAINRGHSDRDQVILRVARADKRRFDNYRVALEMQPGPDGGAAFLSTRTLLAREGIECVAQKPTKAKILRATPLAGAIKYGSVRILDGCDWTEPLLNELRLFPGVDHDDRTDSAAHAYNALTDWANGKI